MLLTNVKLGPFRSIHEAQEMMVDPEVTILVGMNEAGKTVFLKGLQKTNDALAIEQFHVIEDYPRKDLAIYNRRHEKDPDKVAELTFKLNRNEIEQINNNIGCHLKEDFTFSLIYNYKNQKTILCAVDERPVLDTLIAQYGLDSNLKQKLHNTQSLREISELFKNPLTDNEYNFLNIINQRLEKTNWDNVAKFEVWNAIKPLVPTFLYFNDYHILPGKLNVDDLVRRVKSSNGHISTLPSRYKAILSFLRMAEVSIEELLDLNGYESLKVKLEGVR